MSADEFAALADPDDVWKVVGPSTPFRGRKWVLTASALTSMVSHLLHNEQTLLAVAMLDRFADRSATTEEWAEAVWNAQEAAEFCSYRRNATEAQNLAASAVHRFALLEIAWGMTNARNALADEADKSYGRNYRAAQNAAGSRQSTFLRELFGNPFCRVAFDAAWRTSTATALAQTMYESRDFGAMPILADALQDAGCGSDDILNHCRDATQVHVRGCWVVDLVLGKA
jgi:hypothetical protein